MVVLMGAWVVYNISDTSITYASATTGSAMLPFPAVSVTVGVSPAAAEADPTSTE